MESIPMKLKARSLLEALISIRDEGVTHTQYGICGNVFHLLNIEFTHIVDGQLDDLFTIWITERYNESTYLSVSYPVGGNSNYGHERERGTLWNNLRRFELLHWLIMKLENPEL